MCAIFGWLDYKCILPNKLLNRLTQALANAAEERGKDASGIAYNHQGQLTIYKRPKPAHRVRFHVPNGIRAVMGHTRFATQGSHQKNDNNHPFYGKADKAFAFAHNGVIYNDTLLRRQEQLPETAIETDSYIAVQLLEKYGNLEMQSLQSMAEAVCGSFVFTLLDAENTLYLLKGTNPLLLIHFETLGLYVYASTESILKTALQRVGMGKLPFTIVETNEGDILRIDKTGLVSSSAFRVSDWDYYGIRATGYSSMQVDYGEHEEMLLSVCTCYGIDPDDVEILLEYGYTADEIEEMLTDHTLLHEILRSIKLEDDIYALNYGGAFW